MPRFILPGGIKKMKVTFTQFQSATMKVLIWNRNIGNIRQGTLMQDKK